MANEVPDKVNYIYDSQLDAFTLYHLSQETADDAVGAGLPALGHALSGAAGTAISKLITYPLDIVITRLQVQKQLQLNADHQHYEGILDAIEKIYEREGGLPAFYNGVLFETLKGVADSFLFFLAYSYLRQRRLNARDGGRNLPVPEEIGVGIVAGAFSKFFTTPVQQIITRKQTAAMTKQDSSSSSNPSTRTSDIAHEIYKEKGLQGFWSGYSATLVLTLNPSITMLLHKVLLRVLVPRAKRSDPGARTTFLLAAVSKALASTITYPFSLAKTRAQISSQKPTTTTGETSEINKSEKLPQSRTARLRQRTVFSTILRIAQTEDLWALYQGLGAEVLKGFFSHGITMLMKNRIHSAIISLYYTLSQSLQKYPSPKELTDSAAKGAKDILKRGKDQASEVYAKGVEVGGSMTESIKETAVQGSEKAAAVLEKGKEQAGQAVDAASSATQNAVQSGSGQAAKLLNASKDTAMSTYQQTGDLLEKGQNIVQETSEQALQLVTNTIDKVVDGAD